MFKFKDTTFLPAQLLSAGCLSLENDSFTWIHKECLDVRGWCVWVDPEPIESYLHYIDAFLEALDRVQEPEEEWP